MLERKEKRREKLKKGGGEEGQEGERKKEGGMPSGAVAAICLVCGRTTVHLPHITQGEE